LSITNYLCSHWTTAELENPPLPFLLAEWMGSELVFSCWRGKFINKERSQWEYFQWKQFAKDRAEWVERSRQFRMIGREARECGDPYLSGNNKEYTTPILELNGSTPPTLEAT
jgi:hypothetical protein